MVSFIWQQGRTWGAVWMQSPPPPDTDIVGMMILNVRHDFEICHNRLMTHVGILKNKIEEKLRISWMR
jgi:hypothetical protein